VTADRYPPKHLAPPWEPGWGEQYGGLREDQFVDFWRNLQDVAGSRVMPHQTARDSVHQLHVQDVTEQEGT
jgi:hypothetical protein